MPNAICIVGNHELMALECLEFLMKEITDMSIEELDEEMLDQLVQTHSVIITMEENVINGGYGMAVLRYYNTRHTNVKVINFAVPNSYVEQGSRDDQLKECGLDLESILKRLETELI